MGAGTSKDEMLRQADVRLCKISLWTNYDGFGFNTKSNPKGLNVINIVESNSPAAAAGLKIWDTIIAVNGMKVIEKRTEDVCRMIESKRNAHSYVELLVVGQNYNENLKLKNISCKSNFYKTISAPSTMPIDFANFPKNTPRIYDMWLGLNDTQFGFEIVIGDNNVGAYIQNVINNSLASKVGLRLFDRIVEINNENVERQSGEFIHKKITEICKTGVITLLVADTHTYEYYINNRIKFDSNNLMNAVNQSHKTNDATSSTVAPKHNTNTALPPRIPNHTVTRPNTRINKSNSSNDINEQQPSPLLPSAEKRDTSISYRSQPNPYNSTRSRQQHRKACSRDKYSSDAEHSDDSITYRDQADDGSTYSYESKTIYDKFERRLSNKNVHHSKRYRQFQENFSDDESTYSCASEPIDIEFEKRSSDNIRYRSKDNYYSDAEYDDYNIARKYHSDNRSINRYEYEPETMRAKRTNNTTVPSFSKKFRPHSANNEKKAYLTAKITKAPVEKSMVLKSKLPPVHYGSQTIVPKKPGTSTSRYHSEIDLQEPIPHPVIKVDNALNGRIQLCRGDITNYTVDAIVISSTSTHLRKSILQAAGVSVTNSCHTQYQQQKNASIYTNGGNLPCKRIYFIPCPKLTSNADKWVFRDFIHEAIRMVNSDPCIKVRSIAFPAIGCGQIGCKANFVAKTLILAVAYEFEHQTSLRLNVSFVILQHRTIVFNAFQTELTAFKNNKRVLRQPPSPKIVQPKFVTGANVLSKFNNEYQTVVRQFTETMTKFEYSEIVRIELIWNIRWYKQYQIHKTDFLKRLKCDTEKCLFHGCSEESAKGIMTKGFDRSYAGKNGVSYGYGVYFSTTAKYSHKYAVPNANGDRCMFLAKVLIGQTTQGNSSMKVCPIGYDTTTNGSNIYVIYHDTQAFGNFLITYR